MDLKDLFFKILEEKCKENFDSYKHLYENNDLHGSSYQGWFNWDTENFKETPYDYEQFKEKFINELLHVHGPVTFDIHRKFCI